MKRLYKVMVVSCIGLSGIHSSYAASQSHSEVSVQTPQQYKFEQICDGSAAVRLGDTHLLVANDETNEAYVFPNHGGPPTTSIDLNKHHDLVKDSKQEIDIEGMAVVNQTIWWIGSHGLDGDGVDSPGRRTLFSTNFPMQNPGDLAVQSHPIDLTDALLESVELKKFLTSKVRDTEPKKGGLNIEGLAQGQDDKDGKGLSLIVGFRSPLTGSDLISGNAIVARVAGDGKSFSVDKTWLLDLKNRGVRDIIKSGDSYIILAGNVDEGGSFALFGWDGNSDHVTALQELGAELGFEAVVDMGDRWLLLADDGSVRRGQGTPAGKQEKCKDFLKDKTAPQNVYFRGLEVNKQ